MNAEVIKTNKAASQYGLSGGMNQKIPRATEGQTYYYIDENIKISFHLELNDCVDERFYKSGNYFLTKEQAERVLVKLKQAIEEAHNDQTTC